MIRHIVLFKLKPSATAEQIAAAEEALLAMRSAILEIKEVRFGPNLGPSVRHLPRPRPWISQTR